MSKQFQIYLLPADAEALIHALRSRLGIYLMQPWSQCAETVELQSPISSGGVLLGEEAVHIRCCIAPYKGADIRMKFLPRRSHWSVDMESEIIEFSGCEFDGRVLLQGRFYFQNDILVGDAITPKRSGFLEWADDVFRLAKKSLYRSKTLDAYVGEHAQKWREQGGKFASSVTAERKPIYV